MTSIFNCIKFKKSETENRVKEPRFKQELIRIEKELGK